MNIPISYVNVPADIHQNQLPKNQLLLRLNAGGFQLLKNNFNKPVLQIDFDRHKLRQKKFWISDNFKNRISSLIGNDIRILDIEPDTIFVNLNHFNKKNVYVQLQSDLTYKPGFKNKTKIQISPEKMWIFGAEEALREVDSIKTEILKEHNISQDIKKDIKLIIPNNLKVSQTKASVFLDVDQFFDDEKKVDFKVINAPGHAKIILFPSKEKVVYKVFKDDYSKVKSEDFEIVLDYDQVKRKKSVLTPRLIKSPDYIFDVHIIPEKVEFLIKR